MQLLWVLSSFQWLKTIKRANPPAAVAADAVTVPTAAHAISNYVKIQAEKERFQKRRRSFAGYGYEEQFIRVL